MLNDFLSMPCRIYKFIMNSKELPKPPESESLPVNSYNKDEVSVKDFIIKIRRWRNYIASNFKIMFIVAALGALIGFVYAYFSKPIYTASTSFVLEDDQKGGGLLGQYSGLASMVGVDLGGNGGGLFEGDNIIELYKSRKMIQKALLSDVRYNGQNKKLVDIYIDLKKLREKWNTKPQLKNINFNAPDSTFNRAQDSILSRIVTDLNLKYLSVAKPDKKLAIFEVTVQAEDEIFAKLFNDRVVQTVNDFYVNTKTKKAIQNLRILQHQTDSVRVVLNDAIVKTAQVSDATPNLNPGKQVLRAPSQRFIYNAEANKAILTQLVQNLEIAKLSLRKETPLIQVIDSPRYPLQKDKISKIKSLILGGAMGLILTLIFLSVKRMYIKISNIQ